MSSIHRVLAPVDSRRVLLISTHHIDLFDTSGVLLATIGREGTGPGEFRSTVHAGVTGERAWIFDIELNRITEIDLTSAGGVTMRPGLPHPTATNLPIATSSVVALDGGTHFIARGLVRDDFVAPDGQQVTRRPGLAAITSVDTTGRVDRLVALAPPRTQCIGPDRVVACQRHLFAASESGSLLALLEVEDVSDRGVEVLLRHIERSGATVRGRRLRLPGRPVGTAQRDSMLQSLASSLSPGRDHSRLRYPPVFPIAHAMLVGEDGTTWLVGGSTPSGREYFVIDPDAALVNRVYLDRELVVGGVSRDGAWAARELPDGRAEVIRIVLQ